MATQYKILPPYAPAIEKALKEGMSFEAIDSSIGWESGRSEDFYQGYVSLCKIVHSSNKSEKVEQ